MAVLRERVRRGCSSEESLSSSGIGAGSEGRTAGTDVEDEVGRLEEVGGATAMEEEADDTLGCVGAVVEEDEMAGALRLAGAFPTPLVPTPLFPSVVPAPPP